MDIKRLSSDNTDPQLLLESGPMLLREFNPKGVLRFAGRKCVTCDGEIMDHWLRSGSGEYWCSESGLQSSEGITDCVYDVPEGFGLIPVQVPVQVHEQPTQLLADKKHDEY